MKRFTEIVPEQIITKTQIIFSGTATTWAGGVEKYRQIKISRMDTKVEY